MVARFSILRSFLAGVMLSAAVGVTVPSFAQTIRVGGAKHAPSPTTPPPLVPQTKAISPSVGTKLTWHAGRGAPQVLWTGFRAQKKDSEVLIQTSGAVDLESTTTAGNAAAVFVLKKCRAPRRTDRLPLETRFFDSPITRVAVKQRGRDVQVTVSLRGAVAAATRKEAGPGGSWFWVLRFPPATEEPRTTTASAIP